MKEQKRSAFTRLVGRLASIRFALILLFILGLFLLVEATLPFSFVRESYIFALLCLILVTSLIVCHVRRIGRTVGYFLRGIPVTSSDSILSLPLQAEVASGLNAENALASTARILKGHGFRVLKRNSSLLYADRGRTGFPGSLLLHLGIIVVIVGMGLGAVSGFEGTVNLTTGQSFTEEKESYKVLEEGWNTIFLGSHQGFETRLDDFQVVYGEDFQPVDYVSRVTLTEDGREVLSGDIRVNAPLEYDGVKIYQSTYGWAPKVEIEKPSGDVLLKGTVYCNLHSNGIGSKSFTMPGTPISIEFIVIPDQAETGSIENLSPLPNNPVLLFVTRVGNKIMAARDIPLGTSAEVSGLTVSFEDLEMFSGLQVASKPEVPVIYSGFVIFILGLFLIFYVAPRWVWVLAEPQETGTRIILRSSSGRKGRSFRNSFAELAEVIEKSLGRET